MLFIIKKINWMKIDFTYRQKLTQKWKLEIKKIHKNFHGEGNLTFFSGAFFLEHKYIVTFQLESIFL